MSTNKNISSSLAQLLIKIKQLPYIGIKKSSRWYLIPHKPHRPKLIHFNIATAAIKQHSLKYNQYFSSDKLWQKVSQKFEQKISDQSLTTQMRQQQKYQQQWDDYFKKAKQYDKLYKQPLKLMAINRYCLFKRQFFKKIREEKEKIQNQQQQKLKLTSEKDVNQQSKQEQVSLKKGKKKTQPQKKGKNTKNSTNTSKESIAKVNDFKVNKVWLEMPEQQKKVYDDKLQKLRQQNETRIKQFIRNHQVPVVKRQSTMSRYLSKYGPIYGLKICDPEIYVKYRALPEQEKKALGEEAKQMNKECKQRLEIFLNRLNISKQQLEYILDVSDKYTKTKRVIMKQSVRVSYEEKKKRQRRLQGQEQQEEDIMDEDFELEEDIQNLQQQKTTIQSFNNSANKEDKSKSTNNKDNHKYQKDNQNQQQNNDNEKRTDLL